MNDPAKPYFLQALDALKAGDRSGAAALIERQLREGNTSANNLTSVRQLAEHIGEIELAIEAAQLAVVPGSAESLLPYWATLATYARSMEALADVERQPAAVRDHPHVLHFRGSVASQFGRFDEARELFRRAIAGTSAATHSWLSLAMIKTFSAGDADLGEMAQLERQPGGSPEARAPLYYALGKAHEDIGDLDVAFEHYSKGASLRRPERPSDIGQFGRVADKLIGDYTADNMGRLRPSGFAGQRALFVTGMPRSGTTLTEQMLIDHSAVAGGGEVNLLNAALIPTLGLSIKSALAYEQRSGASDPWRDIAADYARMMSMFHQSNALVVDKSLGQSLLVGLMLHAMPDARIAWLRRSPDDVALSCFRTYFATGLTWTNSLVEIADTMRIEDRLFAHWSAVIPDRVLAVPYEELVRSPRDWQLRLREHFGLPVETGEQPSPQHERAISTASTSQVREPISTSRIGRAAAFESQLAPFRERYYR